MPRKGSARLPQFGGYGSCFANALRAMKIIQAKHRPYKTTRREICGWMQAEFECSRATAYRLAAAAIDVLELSLDEDAPDAVMTQQGAERRSRPDSWSVEVQHYGGVPIQRMRVAEV
jgi:hypothetical protein